ncbi:hypothetical protein D3248_01660 [Leucobacter zeae]|nr:hypothetical protein [Leucobacter zeae]
MRVLAALLIPRSLTGVILRLGFLWVIAFIAYSAIAQTVVTVHPSLILAGVTLVEHARLIGIDLSGPVRTVLASTSQSVSELTRFLDQ